MILEITLKKYFGYDTFRTGQKEIITSLLSGQSTLGVLPTGTGKSLCYQLPAYLVEGLVLVVSPLIALMEDQVTSLQQRGEKRGIALTSQLSLSEKAYVLQHLSQYKFLFLSPEMLQNPQVLTALSHQKLAFVVVDEAHCVSQWGIDFRPEYRLLPQSLKRLGNPVVLALTATATKAVVLDIASLLLGSAGKTFQYSADRPNIAYFVEEPEDKFLWLQQYLMTTSQAGLIYCGTRKEVEMLYQKLKDQFSVGYYHGGLSADQRKLLQQQFLEGDLQIMIATSAFGMGINKRDIDFVIHYQLPDSPENYLQESGRAGRDGQAASAILLYHTGDERVHRFFKDKLAEERQGLAVYLQQSGKNQQGMLSPLQEKWLNLATTTKDEQFILRLENHEDQKEARLQVMLDYIAYQGCRREFLLAYFGEEITNHPSRCCDFHEASPLLEEKSEPVEFSKKNSSWQQRLLKLFKDEVPF